LMEPVEHGNEGLPSGPGGNGHKPVLSSQERVAMANGLLREIQEMGIVVQDWRRGLIDFPHVRDGVEILLCYELCDGPEIRFYHDLESGFAGRLPLDE
jgi:hypothetical protein